MALYHFRLKRKSFFVVGILFLLAFACLLPLLRFGQATSRRQPRLRPQAKDGAEIQLAIKTLNKASKRKLARGSIHVAGWQNCSNFRKALTVARRAVEARRSVSAPAGSDGAWVVTVHDLETRESYKDWVYSWLWTNIPEAKVSNHTTSPAIWVGRSGHLVQWVGGREDLTKAA